jgi:hypothetical protein
MTRRDQAVLEALTRCSLPVGYTIFLDSAISVVNVRAVSSLLLYHGSLATR